MKMRMVAVLSVLACSPLVAQAQQLDVRGFEGYVGYADWVGSEVESVDPGLQVGVIGLAETAPRVGFGTELVLGFYEQLGVEITELGVNGVFRYSLGPRTGVHGYLQGRIGWSRLAANSLTQDGFVIGPEVGLELPLGPRTRLIAAGGGTWRAYQNVNVGMGFPVSGGGASGWQLGGRLGLAVGQIF